MSKSSDWKSKALADAFEQIEIDKIFMEAKLDNERDILHDRREVSVAKTAVMKEENHRRKEDLRHKTMGAKVSRSIDEEMAKTRSEDHKDILNFRNEHSKRNPERNEEERLEILRKRIFDHATAKGWTLIDQVLKHARQIENIDIMNFRRELAFHKENVLKEARDAIKEQMVSETQVAMEDRKLDQATSVKKHHEHMDRMHFRRETAVNAIEQSENEKELDRLMMKDRGLVAIHDKRVDSLLKTARMEEDRDILNFRRELAEAKAAKDIADSVEQNSILVSNRLIAQAHRRMDMLLEKARREENRDILHFRRYGSVAYSDH